MMQSENLEKNNKSFVRRNEKTLSFLFFIAGFIFDAVTLTKVTVLEASLILGIYLAVIAFCMVLFNTIGERTFPGSCLRKSVSWIPFLIQFMFGTLLNASFIFFTESAELATSWPFLTFLALIVLGNEVLHRKRDRLTFQFTVFFVSEFLYFVLVIPILVGKMGTFIFILSGLISVAILMFLAWLLSRFAGERYFEGRKIRFSIIFSVYIIVNFLYFTNIIPPIPLSLKDVGVYHSITKISSGYRVEYEPETSPFVFWRKESNIFHVVSGESAYLFSAIFAPTSLTVPVMHEWSYFDQEKKVWVVTNKIKYVIEGGRDAGYRGYSKKDNITPGLWRVVIMTEQGQRIGSVSFTVIGSTTVSSLKDEVK